MLFYWQRESGTVNTTTFFGQNSPAILVSYLNAGGRHLRRFIVDLEPVPARRQRVVADQILDGSVLDLCGVKVHAPVGITQSPMASRVTLRC